MSVQYVCAECRTAGFKIANGYSDMPFVACAFCGAVDERATHMRNTIDVSDTFGTLMNSSGAAEIQFREYREKTHEDFIDQLLHVYLVEPTTRLVERSAEHFKAGVKTWYNRMRHKEQRDHGYKTAPTRNNAKRVKYRVVVAIQFAIQESNIFVVNNRLAHLKPLESATESASRGDGSVMAPSLDFIFSRAQSLGSDHIGYLDSMEALRKMHARFKKLLDRQWSSAEIAMAHFYSLSQRVQLLLKLSPDSRLRQLRVRDLKPAAVKAKQTVENAGVDDFVLDTENWDYMSKVDWNQALEVGYQLFCAQQVVCLWGNLCSVNIAAAVFIWAVQSVVGAPIPAMLGWTKELTLPYGGNMDNCVRRRGELLDQLVGWSTSFPDAGISVPLLPPPRKGTMGDGITGYGSDKRRPIPETVMAIAAAPLIASNWRKIMHTRLRTRTQALPLDTEFTMAAKMYAQTYDDDFQLKKAEARAAKQKAKMAKSLPTSRARSKASSRGSSVAQDDRSSSQPPAVPKATVGPSSAPRGSSFTREDMLRRMDMCPTPPARALSPSIEALLATRDDSSDEDGSADSGDEAPPKPQRWAEGSETLLGLSGAGKPAAFGFTIGPDGFRVATKESDPRATVPVGVASTVLKRGAESSSALPSAKRSRMMSTVPMSPPVTSPSVQAPSPGHTATRQPSPAPTINTVVATASARAPPYQPSATPSLREISPSPSLTEITVTGSVLRIETDATRHIGLLLREREQYAFFHPRYEARKGRIASVPVQNAMNAWVTKMKAQHSLPQTITREYLESLGFHGDPRKQDLGPFVVANSYRWSPTESLLRLGLKPIEFPPHLVVHSLIDLDIQVNPSEWEDKLAPIGTSLTEAELDDELGRLFAHGDENWRELLSTPAEVKRKEKMYRQQGIWDHPRNVPEGLKGALAASSVKQARGTRGPSTVLGGQRASTRINYDALQRLCYNPGGGDDEEDEKGEDDRNGDDEEYNVRDVVNETLWSAIGHDTSGSESDEEDDA